MILLDNDQILGLLLILIVGICLSHSQETLTTAAFLDFVVENESIVFKGLTWSSTMILRDP